MRCLHCGSTLSTFKKLTDSDFCSAEHRDVFYSEQQRLILERLRHSAARFQRLRRGSTVDAAVAPRKVEEAQAPAKLAEFLYAKLEAQQRSFGLRSFLAEGISIAIPIYPQRVSSRRKNSGLLASLVSDLLWPRYNPGSHLEDFRPAEFSGDVEFGSIFDLRGKLHGGVGAFGLAPSPTPDVADVVLKRAFPLRMAKPKARVALEPVRLVRFESGIFNLAGAGYRDFVKLVAIEAPKPDLGPVPHPIEAAGSGLGISGALRSKPGTRGVAFLDRLHRMRWKPAVLSSDVAAMRSLPIDLLSATLEPTLPSGHVAARLGGELRSGHALRALIQGVQAEQRERMSPLSEVGFEGNPSLPSTRVSQEFAPVSLDRFFRPRPRGPVSDDQRALMQTLASEPNGFVSQVCRPAVPEESKQPVLQQHGGLIARVLEGLLAERPNTRSEASHVASPISTELPSFAPEIATCEPVQQDRFFRVRLSGPVDRTLPELAQLTATEEVLFSGPSVCALRRSSPSIEPAICDRMFRMRPRSGVMSANLDDLNASTTPELLLSRPATPQMAALTDFAPAPVTRMFRMRPRSGVDSATSATVSVALAPAVGHGTVAKPGSRPQGLAAGVVLLDRLYPSKPSAATVGNVAGRSSILTLAAVNAGQPTVIGSQVAVAGNFAPPIVGHMFLGHLRAGIYSECAAAFSTIDSSFVPVPSTPSVHSMDIGPCTPQQLIRLFRVRPKSGVDSATRSIGSGVIALPFPPQKPEFIDDWWDVVTGAKPVFMNRMFRMRFKNPAQDTDTLSQSIRTKHVPSADPDPVIASLPKNSVVAAPTFLDRLYRMRPKSGKAMPPSANSIPCNALEPKSNSGVPSAVLQSISKQWKATPLSVKTIAAAAPLLLILALFPLGMQSQAAADPLREAVVQRAAVEHSEDSAPRSGSGC